MTMSITIDQTHIDQVLSALRQRETWYRLDAAEALCPHLTVDQVFWAIDYLTRSGQAFLRMDANQAYWLMALHPVAVEYSLASSADVQSMKQGPTILLALSEQEPRERAHGLPGRRTVWRKTIMP